MRLDYEKDQIKDYSIYSRSGKDFKKINEYFERG